MEGENLRERALITPEAVDLLADNLRHLYENCEDRRALSRHMSSLVANIMCEPPDQRCRDDRDQNVHEAKAAIKAMNLRKGL